MAGKPRGKKTEKIAEDAVAARRAQVTEWYFQAISQREMAAALDVSPATISADIAFSRAEWLNDRKTYINKWVNKELERIEWLEQEATEAWEKSKSAWTDDKTPDAKRGDVVTTVGSSNGAAHKSVTHRLSHGNPKYLDDIKWCVEMRSKLLGLIVDKKDFTSDGKPVAIAVLKMPLDEI